MSEENTSWVEQLPEGLRDVPFLKDAPDMETFKTRLIGAAEHMGNSMRIPGPDATQEHWDAFNEKLMAKVPGLVRADVSTDEGRAQLMKLLGKPDKADEYGAEGEGAWLADVALNAGLTKAQFKSLVEGVSATTKQRTEQMSAEQQQALDALSAEWGLSKTKKMEHIEGLIKLTEAPESMLTQLKENKIDATTLRWLDKLAGQFAEASKFSHDRNDPNGLTPVEARAQIQELLDNKDLYRTDAIGKQLQKKMVELQAAANPQASRSADSLRSDMGLLDALAALR
jgi:hypothetical protein